jgi:hypothetical protein
MSQSLPLLRAALIAASLWAAGPATAQLASCAELLTAPPLAGNPAVFNATSVQATSGGRPYCNVSLTWRDPALVGGAAGYADPPSIHGFQSIRIGIALPLNSNSGDAAWGGRLILTAGGGSQGSVPGLAGMITMNPAAIGAGTDSGHEGGGQTDWGIVVPPNTPVGLNYGKLKDWAGGRANGVAVKLAKQLAQAYYGRATSRTYWNGCSGAGQMGLSQVMYYPEEYDGAVLGAPSNHWQRMRLVNTFDRLVYRKVAQQTSAITTAQMSAATAGAVAACDANDGVLDGVISDPRSCKWSAQRNVCGEPGAPAAPNCLNAVQADGIDQIWDGPRNRHGKLMFPAYDRGVSRPVSTAVFATMVPSLHWNHLDPTLDGSKLYLDQESIDLAAAAGQDVSGATTYEQEMLLASTKVSDYADTADVSLLANARQRGMKVLMYHGTADSAIPVRKSIDLYTETAAEFGRGNLDGRGHLDYDGLQQWFRYFDVPGGGHCVGVPQALPALIDWVENGNAPDSLVQTSGRKLCPFPQQAIYSGSGSTTDPNNFTCGGNVQTKEMICAGLRTPYKNEGAREVQGFTRFPAASCNALAAPR